MTKEEKIKMLTGARVAVLNARDSRFRYFTTITRDLAEDFLEECSGIKFNFWGLTYLGITFANDPAVVWVCEDYKLACLA